MLDKKEVIIRFLAGGLAVVACYIVARISPWKALGGIFAAFPAVMAVAVSTSGVKGGDEFAADVALGAVSGMSAGVICVGSVLVLLPLVHNWIVALCLALVIWLISAVVLGTAIPKLLLNISGAKEHNK